MMLPQVPVPPLPPTPAPEAVIVGVGGGVQQYVVIGVTVMVGFIILGIILYPLMKAFARRLEGRISSGVDPALLERVTELEHRLAEAEERIDFNERMLAQREPVALPRDKAD
jgi:flagellar biosynthesis/type III secretory pathway M-ring protein FliF/YscJ